MPHCSGPSATSRTSLYSEETSAGPTVTPRRGSKSNVQQSGSGQPRSFANIARAAVKKKAPKVIKIPKLPIHLAKKVKDPAYDPDADTSLTDNEISLLERWAVRAAPPTSTSPPSRARAIQYWTYDVASDHARF